MRVLLCLPLLDKLTTPHLNTDVDLLPLCARGRYILHYRLQKSTKKRGNKERLLETISKGASFVISESFSFQHFPSLTSDYTRTMSDRKCSDDVPNTLSTRDAVDLPDDASLSDSDPEESYQPLSRKVEELSSSSDDEIVQHENSLPQGSPTFKLTGGSMGFSYRSKNIFDQLNSAVKLTSGQLAEDNVIDGTFARPAPPSPPMTLQEPVRIRKAPIKAVPDYQLHPERWTRYDLDDVPGTDNRTNSQVAHEFIQGLQNRRRSQEAAESSFSPAFNQDRSGAEHKVIFTKPSQCSKDESQNLQVVDRAKTKEVGLVHLDDELEEEEKEEERKIAAPYNLSAQKKKRKWMDRGNIDEEDKDKGTNVMFSSVRKVNRKNIRKAVEDED